MTEKTVASVAVEGLAYHFDAPYSYAVPTELSGSALPGCRVLIPFGNGNVKKQGVILDVSKEIAKEERKLKRIAAILDEKPLFDSEMLALIPWLKQNTFCTLFEAARAMLPTGIGLNFVVSYIANESCDESATAKLRGDELLVYEALKGRCAFVKKDRLLSEVGLPLDSKVPDSLVKKGFIISNVDAKRKTGDLTVKNARLCLSEEEAEEALKGVTQKQKTVLKLLLDIGCASVKEICYFTGVTEAVVKALEKKKYIELIDSEVYRKPKISADVVNEKIELTEDQNKAYRYLLDRYHENKGSAALLYGVTGSGKTQVFLKLIEETVKEGRDVIVMVPEISLTPQTLQVFYSHFGDTVAVFHSALSAGERIDEWKRVKRGEAKIAIGTRSAVFAPFSNLGLIVMDEEHEHTYKSEMSPRFHARDVAKFRCVQNNALLVLSSATPSLETYKNAMDGRYGFVKLDKRYGKACLPETATVDMTDEHGVISTALFHEIEKCLSEKKQAILLMNRRGFNTFAVCNACKSVMTCPNCSISLTYHSANNRLMCHYCGHSQQYTSVCPQCGSTEVRYAGYGTQRIEDELDKMFPGARVLRMDADTTMSRYSYDEKLSSFAKGDYDILLGTQMVAKGLNFPKVTLVGIISIDQQLCNDDFRSSERAFDLLTQVIGRSGRGDFPGKALIQTVLPDNEIITLAAAQDYESFFEMETVMRKAMVYPPFCDMCTLTFVSENYQKCVYSSQKFMELLKTEVSANFTDVKMTAIGPIQPRLGKINNKYRNVITVKCKNGKRFRMMLSYLVKEFMKDGKNNGVSLITDINPL